MMRDFMLHFIINRKSKSGNGKKVWAEVKTYLTENNIPYKTHVTESQGHAKKIAEELSCLPEEEVRMVIIATEPSMKPLMELKISKKYVLV